MEDMIIQTLFWRQAQILFIMSALLFAGGLSVFLLPWKKEELIQLNIQFLKAISFRKMQGIKQQKQLLRHFVTQENLQRK